MAQIGVSQLSENGFVFNMPCFSTLYADDTTHFTSSKTIEDLIRRYKNKMPLA